MQYDSATMTGGGKMGNNNREKVCHLANQIIKLLGDELDENTCIIIDADGASIVKHLDNLESESIGTV
jgi:hypothetical protein